MKSASMLKPTCAKLPCRKPYVSNCHGMKLVPPPSAPKPPSSGQSMKGRNVESGRIICRRNTRPLAISKALVMGGMLENIGDPGGVPRMITGACVWVGSVPAPDLGIQVQLAPLHAHATVDDRHALGAEAAALFAEAGRSLRKRDAPIRSEHAMPRQRAIGVG